MIGTDSKLLFVIVILILVLMFMFVMPPAWGQDVPFDIQRESGEAMIGSHRVKGDCFFYADGESRRRVLEAGRNEIR